MRHSHDLRPRFVVGPAPGARGSGQLEHERPEQNRGEHAIADAEAVVEHEVRAALERAALRVRLHPEALVQTPSEVHADDDRVHPMQPQVYRRVWW